LELEFLTFELAGQAWNSGGFKIGSDGNILVLIKTIDNVKKIYDAGFKYDKLTIGNMESAPGKYCVNRVFFMNRADIDTLDGIAERGVQIEFKELPETKGVSLETLKSKHLNSLK
jgi:mannose/fructose/N-acetylgalactosamine-specific phosphotransferase system component IIB